MAGVIATIPKFQFSANGVPMVGGTLDTYIAGSTTPATTWQDSDLTIANTNPISLDARGECVLWLDSAVVYKFVLKNAAGVIQWTQDNISTPAALVNTLRTDLAASSGASLVGGSSQVVTSIAALRSLRKTSASKNAFATGYYAPGDGGGGTYWYDSTDTTSADNGGSIIVATDEARWKLQQTTPQTLAQFGAVLDGVADDSIPAQKWIDANKGRKIVHDKGTALVAGLSLSGTTYDGTEIICTAGELKLKADSGASTFGGAWIGVLVKDCNRVALDLTFDGNRAAMTATREQIFCVALAGAQDVNIPRLRFREVQGDGIYIAQSDWTISSNPSRRLRIGSVSAYNSADAGRNAMSIISAVDCTVESINSYQVGGVINGVRQPGGLDIEPDVGYHTCEDIVIGVVNVVTAGSSGCAVLGKAVTNDATGDWNTARVTIASYNVRFTSASSSGVAFSRAFDLNIRGSSAYTAGVRNKGCTIDYANRIKADVKAHGCTVGVNVAPAGTVADFEINVLSTDYNTAGLRTTNVQRGKFTGRTYGGPGGATSFGVQCHDEGRGAITQTTVVYEVDAPYDNVMARAFRNEPGNTVSYSATYVRNCDWSGYANPPTTNDAQIYMENVKGLTEASAIPSQGTWAIGTFVRNNTPAVGAGKVTIGWSRLTTGTGNVNGTDWTPCVVTNT